MKALERNQWNKRTKQLIKENLLFDVTDKENKNEQK